MAGESMMSNPRTEWDEPSRKRMRITPPDDNDEFVLKHQERSQVDREHQHIEKDKDKSITIASTAKLAPQAVAPFYAKHIPSQYAPLGDPGASGRAAADSQTSNSRFCYRHRPDMLCRRQADEHTMDKLQQDLEDLPQEDRQGIVQVWSLFSAAPSKHRKLMLQGILSQCCFPQLSFLSANVRELIRIDFIAALPSEISFRILCFLDPTSLCKAAQVSRKWRQLADDDVVWHRMCEQHIDRKCTKCGWGLPLLERKRLRASKRQIQLRASGQNQDVSDAQIPGNKSHSSEELHDHGSVAVAPERKRSNDDQRSSTLWKPQLAVAQCEAGRKTRPWKDVYKDRFQVGTNWKHGRYKLNILKGHTNGVMALQMYDNILATGSYDSTIKIWDLVTGRELRTLTGHTMGIRCLQIDDTKLISGSLDKTLKVWNWRTGECIATYPGHSDGVIGLHFDANILVSASIDRTARVWNFQEKSVYSLRGHEDWVNSVRLDTPSQTLFTASDDCTVKMWDLETRRCIHTFYGHVCQVQQVLLLPPEFDAEDDIPAHLGEDPGTPDSQHTSGSSFMGHSPSPVLAHHTLPSVTQDPGHHLHDPFATYAPHRPRPPRYMLTSALDSTIRLWEVHTGRCIRTFFGHLEGVWALAADTLRIVSGAEDRMVKVWDPRTGKCERTFTGHTGPVTCIGLSDSRMVSAGEDGEIRVYCFNDVYDSQNPEH